MGEENTVNISTVHLKCWKMYYWGFLSKMLLRIGTQNERRTSEESRIPPCHVKPRWNKPRRSRCWKIYIQSNMDTCKHQNCKLGLKNWLFLCRAVCCSFSETYRCILFSQSSPAQLYVTLPIRVLNKYFVSKRDSLMSFKPDASFSLFFCIGLVMGASSRDALHRCL